MEEVGALEMAVALRVLSVDSADVNGDLKSGLSVVGFEAMQNTADSAELASDVGNHHVLDLELGRGVGGIDVPGGGGGGRGHGGFAPFNSLDAGGGYSLQQVISAAVRISALPWLPTCMLRISGRRQASNQRAPKGA